MNTVWIQIRPGILLGLIWIQTICQGYQQVTKPTAGSKRVENDNSVFTFILSANKA